MVSWYTAHVYSKLILLLLLFHVNFLGGYLSIVRGKVYYFMNCNKTELG